MWMNMLMLWSLFRLVWCGLFIPFFYLKSTFLFSYSSVSLFFMQWLFDNSFFSFWFNFTDFYSIFFNWLVIRISIIPLVTYHICLENSSSEKKVSDVQNIILINDTLFFNKLLTVYRTDIFSISVHHVYLGMLFLANM